METTIASRVFDGMVAYIRAERPGYGDLRALELATRQEFAHLFTDTGVLWRTVEKALDRAIPNYYSQRHYEDIRADAACDDMYEFDE